MFLRLLGLTLTFCSFYNSTANPRYSFPEDFDNEKYDHHSFIKLPQDTTYTLIVYEKEKQQLELYRQSTPDSLLSFQKDTTKLLSDVISGSQQLDHLTTFEKDSSVYLYLEFKNASPAWWVISDSVKKASEVTLPSGQKKVATNISFAYLYQNEYPEALNIHHDGHYHLYKWAENQYAGGSDFHHGPDSPFFGLLTFDACAIDFFDLDSDGDDDLIIAKCDGKIEVMENTGSKGKPSFTKRTRFNREMKNFRFNETPQSIQMINTNKKNECKLIITGKNNLKLYNFKCQ